MTFTIKPGQIKKIKVLARQVFGGDDAAYREMLWGQAKVKSCKALKGPAIDLVIRHLERCAGGDARTTRDARATGRTMSQIEFIRFLWDRVSYAPPGEAREKALRQFLKRRFQVAAVEWLTPAVASKVIEALKEMRQRQGSGVRGRGPGAKAQEG